MRSKEEEKGRDVKIGQKNGFFQAGRNGGFTEGRKERRRGRRRRMPLYNLECLYSNGRWELFAPKNAALSALSHPHPSLLG